MLHLVISDFYLPKIISTSKSDFFHQKRNILYVLYNNSSGANIDEIFSFCGYTLRSIGGKLRKLIYNLMLFKIRE